MNLVFSTITKKGSDWLFTWELTDARYYRVVLFGTELAKVFTGLFLYNLGVPSYPKYPPPLELVQETDLAVSEIFPPFITIQWYNDTINEQNVNHYQLQQLNAKGWKDGPVIKEDGSWVHSIVTPVLSDGKTYDFRVLAVGSYDEVSCARPFRVNMVCCPVLAEDQLKVYYDDASQEVVITGV